MGTATSRVELHSSLGSRAGLALAAASRRRPARPPSSPTPAAPTRRLARRCLPPTASTFDLFAAALCCSFSARWQQDAAAMVNVQLVSGSSTASMRQLQPSSATVRSAGLSLLPHTRAAGCSACIIGCSVCLSGAVFYLSFAPYECRVERSIGPQTFVYEQSQSGHSCERAESRASSRSCRARLQCRLQCSAGWDRTAMFGGV